MIRSDADLLRLLRDLKSDQVERKGNASSGDTKDRIRQAICAFANDMPGRGSSGVVFVGARDDGSPTGLTVDDNLLITLADMRSQGKILPLPTMAVRVLTVGVDRVAVIDVEPSLSPPVRVDGQVWIRVGPRRALATAEEERRLAERRRSLDLPFDTRPVIGTTIDDLDVSLFSREYLPAAVAPDVLAANGRSVQEQLSSLRLTTFDGTPTAAGILILAPEPRETISGAYVQITRVDGDDLTCPVIDDKQFDEPLPVLMRELDDYLKVNVRTAVDIGSGHRDERTADYPLAGLQQLLRNALMHRAYEGTNSPVRLTWYSDRIEIFSPGGPFGVVTPANFGTPGVTDYRNPTLAEAMRALGYVQRFGAGLQITAGALRQNGNPPAAFDPGDAYVGVVIRRSV